MLKLHRVWIVAAGIVLNACGNTGFLAAQVAGPRSGMTPSLPLIPEFPTRPVETEEKPWRDTPSDEEKQPTSSFIDSVKVNDAAIEVVLGQGRLITLAAPLATEKGVPVIAVANPGIVDFEILPDQRMMRLVAKAIGVTDLSFISSDGESHSIEVHVTYDTVLLEAQLRQVFPTAMLELKQLREHLIVEGQARSPEQVEQIVTTIEAFLSSIQTNEAPALRSGSRDVAATGGPNEVSPQRDNDFDDDLPFAYEPGVRPETTAKLVRPQLINLIRVPGSRQVMLKVVVAELNRTAAREIGMNLNLGDFFENTMVTSGRTRISIGEDGENFLMILRALRTNSVATILAEPNLVTLSGSPATFQSGGEFPVPQSSQFGGLGGTTFKDFGVQLSFTPFIQDNGVIRLTVAPEVSNVDRSLGVAIVPDTPAIVPGLRTRNSTTTVELKHGQTLAIAGLLNRQVNAQTARLPVLGDLPILGMFFSSTSHQVQDEVELMVTVTPYIVGPLDADQCIPMPGTEIMEPSDLEVFLMGRISGRTGLPYRSTTNWDDPLGSIRQQRIEKGNIYGPFGFAE